MKFTLLTIDEFIKFSEVSSDRNFFQSINMYYRYLNNHEEVYLVGLKYNNQVLSASIIVAKKIRLLNKKVFYCYKGFLADYNKKYIIYYMSKYLSNFVKEHNGIAYFIDPYIISQERDTNAILINGRSNIFVKDYLINLGYKYLGEDKQVKWTYVKDLGKEEEIFKSFKPNVKNNIRKTIDKYCLVVSELSYNELTRFKNITQDTCNRRCFKDKSLEYYQSMMYSFKDKVKFMIVSLDCDKYLNKLNYIIKSNQDKINLLSNSSSNRMKKINLQSDIDNAYKNINLVNKLKKEKGNIIDLSCAMFILYGDEIVYLFSGSYDEYMKFCGQYRLQYEIIKYGCLNNYKRYNFYGIKDVFNKLGKDYGVYEFKKGFNGYVMELLGCFCYPIGLLGKLYYIKYVINKYFQK